MKEGYVTCTALPPIRVDPHRGGNVDYSVKRSYLVLLVDQNGVLWIRFFDPWSGVLDAADVFRHGDDFKILVLVVREEFLPAWQIQAAASPGGPRDQQDLLPAESAE